MLVRVWVEFFVVTTVHKYLKIVMTLRVPFRNEIKKDPSIKRTALIWDNFAVRVVFPGRNKCEESNQTDICEDQPPGNVMLSPARIRRRRIILSMLSKHKRMLKKKDEQTGKKHKYQTSPRRAHETVNPYLVHERLPPNPGGTTPQPDENRRIIYHSETSTNPQLFSNSSLDARKG